MRYSSQMARMGNGPALALAAMLLILALNVRSTLAYRKLKPLSAGHLAQSDLSGNPVDHFACGYFDSQDPRDAGLAHQPCYGGDGSIQICW